MAEVKILNINTTFPYGWKFDKNKIKERCENLKMPLIIRRKSLNGNVIGGHTLLTESGWHYIEIEKKLTAWWANHTLWHELCHAFQAERWGKAWYSIYENEGTFSVLGTDYKTANKYEQEADYFADIMQDNALVKYIDGIEWRR